MKKNSFIIGLIEQVIGIIGVIASIQYAFELEYEWESYIEMGYYINYSTMAIIAFSALFIAGTIIMVSRKSDEL